MFRRLRSLFRRQPLQIDYAAIRRLDLKPGDVLVLSCREPVSEGDADVLRLRLEPFLEALKARGVVLAPEFRLDVHSERREQHRAENAKQTNQRRDQKPKKDRVAVKTKPRKGGIDRPA